LLPSKQPKKSGVCQYSMDRELLKDWFPTRTKTTFGSEKKADLFYSKEKLSKPTAVCYNIPSVFETKHFSKAAQRSQS